MDVNIQLFKNDRFGEIRVTEIEGKTYFVGSDVAKALGYKNAPKALNDHCRGITKRYIGVETGKRMDGTTAIQQVEMNVIPEGDIYRLAAKSELPGADEFESWIFDEVLPSISKHGGYLTPATIDNIIADPDFGIKLLSSLKEERNKNKELEKENAKLKPKAEFLDRVLDTGEKIDIGQAAKILGLPFGRNTLFAKLREKGIFFQNRNEPKHTYIERKYFELKENWIDRNNHEGFMVVKVLVTQKGLSFIGDLFNAEPGNKKLAKVK